MTVRAGLVGYAELHFTGLASILVSVAQLQLLLEGGFSLGWFEFRATPTEKGECISMLQTEFAKYIMSTNDTFLRKTGTFFSWLVTVIGIINGFSSKSKFNP